MLEPIISFLNNQPPLIANLLWVAVAILFGLFIKWALSRIALRYIRKETGFTLGQSIIKRLSKTISFLLPLLVLNFSLPALSLSEKQYLFLNKTLGIFLIISFSGVLIACIKVAEDYVGHKYNLKKSNNIKERKIRTQLHFLRNLLISIIVIVTICAILLSFESMRRIGAGLLTGVGVGGIIVGFAAQKSLGNLLAGLQIAFTQPIRIDDVLVVEGEWGRVEEITLTYVVVGIWDQRRLILPINYFIETPFQNWTRNSAEILGASFIYLDYTAPLDDIRAEFMRLVNQSELWDKRVAVMQVTNVTHQTLEIRALISAENSGKAFELRCFLREKLISYVQKHHPYCLPRTRAELTEKSKYEQAPTVQPGS
ncbi:MAG: mechanosensitive ion channel [Chitinophagaceae bacterium]|nr:mechanosensitive ion channel [Chitinophagaceae bacterium]